MLECHLSCLWFRIYTCLKSISYIEIKQSIMMETGKNHINYGIMVIAEDNYMKKTRFFIMYIFSILTYQ